MRNGTECNGAQPSRVDCARNVVLIYGARRITADYSSCYVALQIMMCEMRCSSNMPLPYKFFCTSIARSIYTMLSDVVIIANLHIYFCQR